MSEKSDKIKASLEATKERRKTQSCHVYEIKVDRSDLSSVTLNNLRRLFLEAKWYTNASISTDQPTRFPVTLKEVQIKVGDHFETRSLLLLSSQMKQAIISRIGDSLSSLCALKKKGRKVGGLKFKPCLTSIPLKQFDNTYRIVDKNHIRIQNIPEPIKVLGLKQLKGLECANANLVDRAGDYYLMVTCFREKEERSPRPFLDAGIDFNVSAGNQMVLDNHVAIGFSVPVSPVVKREQRKLARQDRENKKAGKTGRCKHTSNRNKTRTRLRKAHLHQNNLKKDIRNQIVSRLSSTYEHLCIQNENLKGWQKLYGRQIRNTALGGILVKLKTFPTTRIVDRFKPTTQWCSCCRRPHHVARGRLYWTCMYCHTLHNRHVNSGEVIRQLGSERAEVTPEEKDSSARWLQTLFDKPCLKRITVRILR